MQRRRLLQLLPAALAAAPLPSIAQAPQLGLTRPIPRGNGARWPVVGLGTWQTFDIGSDEPAAFAQRREVLARFFAAGGGMVDSSPMYGRAEWLIGELLRSTPPQGRLVAATKVWTPFDAQGARQFEQSLKLWGLPRMDVSLVHNLLNVEHHLPLLRERQARGEVRWIGISTSHGRAHDEVERLLRREPMDVLQITYNLADSSAEPLLELAADRGVAVVVNRPFDGGWLFGRGEREAPPAWLREELGCTHWAQVYLKWILGHPAVTCAIPATRNPEHLVQNMAARLGPLPDAAQRQRIRAMVAAR